MTTVNPTPAKTIYAFGTSGYRSDQDNGFNEAVVRQITQSISDYLIDEFNRTGSAHPILIGGDTREKTRRFIPQIAQHLLDNGHDVYQAKTDVPTPVLAYAAKYFNEMGFPHKQSAGCILMTASHNPWAYGGYNFLTPDAAVVPSSGSKKFEILQETPKNLTVDRAKFKLAPKPTLELFDPYPIYKAHLKNGVKINYQLIKDSGLAIFYDPLYATGRSVFPRLLTEEGIGVTSIHDTDQRPTDYQGMPEPVASNLTELSGLVKNSPAPLKVGFANDGDADRFGVLDEQGRFVQPSDVLALTLYHLLKNRKQSGVVVRSQATTHLLDALANQAGLEVVQTPVGYKYIAEEFIERDVEKKTPVMLGGESSGGLSIGGHIPEKDGLLANLLIAELVATEQRPLSDILEMLRASLPQQFQFKELAIKTDQGKAILEGFAQLRESGGEPDGLQIGGLKVDVAKTRAVAEALQSHFHTKDGVKLYLEDGSWVLVRISGTEPMARVYLETVADTSVATTQKMNRLFSDVKQRLISQYHVDAGAIHEKN